MQDMPINQPKKPPPYDRTATANLIHARRKKKKLTLVDLCRMTGLSFTTIYFSDRAGQVSKKTALRLAPILDLKVEDLLPRSEEPQDDDASGAGE
jgi:transcriptional regulator with XRE-family HTH domain